VTHAPAVWIFAQDHRCIEGQPDVLDDDLLLTSTAVLTSQSVSMTTARCARNSEPSWTPLYFFNPLRQGSTGALGACS
jgi:hypothetical protein